MSNQIRVKMLPAKHGDAIVVSWKDETGDHKIIVDSGTRGTYKKLKKEIEDSTCLIDAIFITHVCDDHISGLIKLIEESSDLVRDRIGNIYINAPDTVPVINSGDAGVKHGYNLLKLIDEKSLNDKLKSFIVEDGDLQIGKATLTKLSPSIDSQAIHKAFEEWIEYKNDNQSGDASTGDKAKMYNASIDELLNMDLEAPKEPKVDFANASSIAFILNVNSKTLLLLGDSNPNEVLKVLKTKDITTFDAIKVSHHGSQYNLTEEFLNSALSNRFIISTNGGRHNHPDAITLANLYNTNKSNGTVTFIFNYPQEKYDEHLKGFIADAETKTDIDLEFNQRDEITL